MAFVLVDILKCSKVCGCMAWCKGLFCCQLVSSCVSSLALYPSIQQALYPASSASHNFHGWKKVKKSDGISHCISLFWLLFHEIVVQTKFICGPNIQIGSTKVWNTTRLPQYFSDAVSWGDYVYMENRLIFHLCSWDRGPNGVQSWSKRSRWNIAKQCKAGTLLRQSLSDAASWGDNVYSSHGWKKVMELWHISLF